MIKKEPVNQEPLTIEELKTMGRAPGLVPGGRSIRNRDVR